MDRRAFLGTLGLLVAARAGEAQPAGKVYRIGYLAPGSPDHTASWMSGFRQGLRERGYVEGENVVVEQRYAAAKYDRLPELATELVRLKVDVIVVHGNFESIDAARKASPMTPVVMVANPDPVRLGLVASLARPGGQLTGLSDFHGDLVAKRLELVREMVPSAQRVAVLSNPRNVSHAPQLKDIQTAAQSLRMTMLALEIRGAGDLDRAFTRIGRERPIGVVVLGDNEILGPHRVRIATLALEHRVPAITTTVPGVEAGMLMSYGANFPDLYRRAAIYVDKILKGAKPADLPIEQPTKFELVINLKTAKALGLTIPPSVLVRADEVLQ